MGRLRSCSFSVVTGIVFSISICAAQSANADPYTECVAVLRKLLADSHESPPSPQDIEKNCGRLRPRDSGRGAAGDAEAPTRGIGARPPSSSSSLGPRSRKWAVSRTVQTEDPSEGAGDSARELEQLRRRVQELEAQLRALREAPLGTAGAVCPEGDRGSPSVLTYDIPPRTPDWWRPLRKYFDGKSFVKRPVADDGDCAFAAMGKTRAEWVAELTRALNQEFSHEKADVMRAIEGLISREKERIDDKEAHGEGVDPEISGAMGKLHTIRSLTERCLFFVNQVLSKKAYYATDDVLRQLSQLFRINLFILRKKGASQLELALGSHSAYLVPGATESRYVLYDEKRIHFDGLDVR
jgi:hypothetical protein